MITDSTDTLVKLTTDANERDKWFEFCKQNSPLVSASLDCAATHNLDEIEALKVAICMLEIRMIRINTAVWNSQTTCGAPDCNGYCRED